MTSTTPSVAAPQEQPDFPVNPALIEEMLKLLVKAIRAHQLYLRNNPMYQRAVELLRGSFAPIWEKIDELPLVVNESELKWMGRPVMQEDSKSESLPWLFYKDGVRELRFTRNFEQEEAEGLLEVIQRAKTANPEDDDLISMLWEKDFVHLRYRFVDLASEQVTSVDTIVSEEPPKRVNPQQVMEEMQESKPAGVVSLDDFDATLYFLDEKEIEYLRNEVKFEYDADMRRNVISIVLDIYEQQTDPVVREELTGIIDNFMLHLLSAGQFSAVAFLLREVAQAALRAKELKPNQRETLATIPDRLSAPEALTQLLQSLDESAQLPPPNELGELFEQLRVTALESVFLWVGRLQNVKLRPLLEAAADRLAVTNTGELVRLIASPQPGVASEAIRRAGALRTPAAVSPLAKVLSERDPTLRQLAVLALAEIGSPGALQVLEKALDDTDRDVRVAAARAIAAKLYRPALTRLETVIKGKGIRSADLTEKMAMFETYGSLCGDPGVSLLDGYLNPKGGLFGRKEDPEFRACAAMALGKIGSSAAHDALRRASAEKEILVRNAVNKALSRGTT